MLSININEAVDHGAIMEEVLKDIYMSRAGKSFRVYVDANKVAELPDELCIIARAKGSKKFTEHIKLDQVWSHLTNNVAPFNQRERNAMGNLIPVYPVELISVGNLEGVKRGEEPTDMIIAGDPKQKDFKGRRRQLVTEPYGRTEREQQQYSSAPPAVLRQPAANSMAD